MRKIWLSAVATVVIVLSLFFTSAAQTQEARFVIDGGYTYAGSSVRLNISYFSAKALTNASITLEFDKNTFSFESAEGASATPSDGSVLLDFDGNTSKTVCSIVLTVSQNAFTGKTPVTLKTNSAFSGSTQLSVPNEVKYIEIIGAHISGDVNTDGEITTSDARAVLQAVVEKTTLVGAEKENALGEAEKISTTVARKILTTAISDKGSLEKVEVCINPLKTDYEINEALNVEGAKLLATYSSGIKELIDISDATASGFSSAAKGQKTVTVEYGGKTTQLYLAVNGTEFSSAATTYSDLNGKNFNYLCGVDMYGRSFEPVSGFDTSKDVGLFYFLSVGTHFTSEQTEIYDITKLLSEGREYDVLYSGYGYGMTFFWGKPTFGYYRSGEQWVFNRHMEMLSSAGVDYLLIDVSNGWIYQGEYMLLIKTMRAYKDAGWDVPQIGFYTHFSSSSVMDTLYDQLYSNSIYTAKYGDLYYAPNGKPFIVGDDPSERVAQNMDVRGSYWPQEGEWGTLPEKSYQAFPWIEWVWEPYMHADNTICVSVAQHRNGGFSFQPITPYTALPRTGNNWGRGMDASGNRNEDSFGLGQNFQRQWDIALNKGATNVFMTGWNEWTVGKNSCEDANNVIYFCDQYNPEFSRDIEPVTGGFEDSFYLQMIANIRRYKGISGAMQPSVKKTIDVTNVADFSQWDSVTNQYNNVQFNSYKRTGTPVAGSLTSSERPLYRVAAPVNNITTVKTTSDSQNIYFLIQTSADAVGNTSTLLTDADRWMNVFLSIGSVKEQGWNGYKYVINRTASALTSGSVGTGSINLLNPDGTTGAEVGTATISMAGKYIQIAVPLSSIGATGNEEGLYFKVADNILDYLDITNYYVTGKSFPMGRLSYYYYF